MENYFLILAILGFVVILMAFIPVWSARIRVSYTIPLLLLGIILYYIGVPLAWPDPVWPWEWSKYLTELVVVISLMAAGLKIGVNYKLKDWRVPLALVSFTMPLFIAILFLIGYYILNINGPLALLLATVLAPTDPVLASELQLEEHQDMKEKNTGLRFNLTAEAGINDGLAFPFVFLAILWSKEPEWQSVDLWYWFWYYGAFKIIVGCLIGAIIGFVFSKSVSVFNSKHQHHILNGFVAVALTVFSYGIAELAGTYGFLSVFFTGIMTQFHKVKTEKVKPEGKMLAFVTETEKLLIILWTIMFGGALVSGILSFTDWKGVLVALAAVLIIRPLTAFPAVSQGDFSIFKKWAISFYGIRGIGSVFYLSFAIINGSFKDINEVVSIVSYVILFSMLIHGFSSPSVIEHFKKKERE